jgi:flagellar basal-body rod protein FlgG
MIRGLYTACSGMMAQMINQDCISNNLANVDQTGYKRDVTIFHSFPEMLIRRMYDTERGVYETEERRFNEETAAPLIGSTGTGCQVAQLATIFTHGTLQKTDNPLDIAIVGDGFFVVETPMGEMYTRNGNFTIDQEGFLVTTDGNYVLGEGGRIEVSGPKFVVDEDGRIMVNPQAEDIGWASPRVIDKFRIVTFENLGGLEKVGSCFYTSTQASGPAIPVERPQVQQGHLEKSNVNVILEMVEMIKVSRAYEACQKVIQAEDGMIMNAINRLAARA